MTRARDLANIADGTFTATDLNLSGTLDVSGDATFDTNTLFVDVSANNVGIGTTSFNAANKLEVTGDINTTWASGASRFIGMRFGDGSLYEMGLLAKESPELQVYAKHAAGAPITFLTGATPDERMRIDASGNVVIGATSVSNPNSYGAVLNVEGYAPALVLSEDTGRDYTIGVNGNNLNIFNETTNVLTIADSGNVGVGTTSPGRIVEVGGSQPAIKFNNGTHAWSIGTGAFVDGSDSFVLFQDGTGEALRVDSSGSVGIGTTDTGNAVLSVSKTSAAHVYSRINGSDTSFEAGLQFADQNTLKWTLYKPGNSNNLAFYNHTGASAAMTLDSSGNLLVGRTSTITFGSNTTTGAVINEDGRIDAATDGQSALILQRLNSDGNIALFYKDGSTVGSIGSFSGSKVYIGSPSSAGAVFATNGVMPVTDGSLADNAHDLGQSSARWKDLYLSGVGYVDTIYSGLNLTLGADEANDSSAGNSNILFKTDGTEKARIDSSGNLLVGTTTASGKFVVEGSGSAAQMVRGHATNASYTGQVIQALASRNTTNESYEFLRCSVNGVADRLKVYDNGNVENTNNSYGSLSDIKLKENVVDASAQWDDIKNLRFRKYNFKEETGQSTHTQMGLIAQEAELICPGIVKETTDRDQEGNDLGTTTKSIQYSLVYVKAVKALQEAMARIETLEAEVAALKGA